MLLSARYNAYVAYNWFRNTRSREFDDLTEQVVSLTVGFKELSNTVVSALENISSAQSGISDPVYKYSKNLPALKPANISDFPFWYRAPWSEIRNGRKLVDKGDDPILTLFFEDANGKIVPKSEIQAVRNLVRAYFELLWTHKRAPPRWGDAPLDLQIDFIRNLEEEFEFLRYCDRHWKSEQIFMNYYPTWYSGKTGNKPKKSSKRARPDDNDDDNNNNNTNGDADDNTNDNANDGTSRSKRPRVGAAEPDPPPVQSAPTTLRKRNRVCSLT